MAVPDVPHLAVPFQLSGTRAATVQDGTEDEVRQNVAVLVATRPGERLCVPQFGLPDPTFGPGGRTPSSAVLEAAVARWEPRARLALEYDEPTDDGEADVLVHVSMEGD